MNKVLFSCVVDSQPKFRWQCNIYINTLLKLAGVNPEDIYIHVIDPDPSFLSHLTGFGVNIVSVQRWGEGKYCNKFVQFETDALCDAHFVFLCDCDLAFVDDIRSLPLLYPDRILAKTVDAENPPLPILEEIFDRYGLRKPPVVNTCVGKSYETNCNGGFLGIPGSQFKKFGQIWGVYATKLLKDETILSKLGKWSHHVDQISFCMALTEPNFTFQSIDTKYNTPTHQQNFLPQIIQQLDGKQPSILHYHSNLNQVGLLAFVGIPNIDASVSKVNKVLKSCFDNMLFWDFRYSNNPELGSGVGSRGDTLELKRKMLKLSAVERFASVLDVGCGDGEVLAFLNLSEYVGIDLSREALELSKQKRPNGKYYHFSEKNNVSSADVVICLDVLIHQSKYDDYKDLINYLVEKTDKRLIVSGYNSETALDSSYMCYYFEDLKKSLDDSGAFVQVFTLAKYRNLEVLVADKAIDVLGVDNNHNDIGQLVLREHLASHPLPEQFLQSVAVSRGSFGWFTKHYPRAFEYPWILEKLGEDLKSKVIADFGAGISPLPLMLSMNGAKVFTVDYGKPVLLKDVFQKNEWGFFDYSQIDAAISSINARLSDETLPMSSLDAWFSVSVIEHTPATERRKILNVMSRTLKNNGDILLTVDLKRGTNFLWNYNAGQEVEPFDIHGTLDDLLNELGGVGFFDINVEILPMPEAERVDIAFISAKCTKTKMAVHNLVVLQKPNFISILFRRLVNFRDSLVLRRSGLLDVNWYLQQNQDIAESGCKPYKHYVSCGWREKRLPSQDFNPEWYIKSHDDDVVTSTRCPLVKYIDSIDYNNIVPWQVLKLMRPLNFSSMYELGNKKNNGVPYSVFYKRKGIDYTSIDLNGLDGALALDLNEHVDLPARELVANIGTSEHVRDQKILFQNIHNLSSSRMVHWVPLALKHPEHGYWGYDEDFFTELAKLNNYIVEKLYIEKSFKSWHLVCCAFKKRVAGSVFKWDKRLHITLNVNGSGGISYK
ncbi:MAG: class I SAM-dependent methyltransferase [Desulfobacteraceae bacterium]|nr:MAG: class I SAM-dependent methyltransferase [Desulfobacteraceae bacterium]